MESPMRLRLLSSMRWLVMHIALMSDLHCEIERPRQSVNGHPDRGPNLQSLKESGADVLVLAGDIERSPESLVDYLCQVNRFLNIPIICVLGNHEYFGAEMRETLGGAYDHFRRARQRGHEIHVLERSGVTLSGVHFLGATLWTDFELHGPEYVGYVMSLARGLQADYREIRYGGRRLTPMTCLSLHRKTVRWLEKELSRKRAQPVVVVTHHAPARGSIVAPYHDDYLTATYVSDLEDLVRRHQPEAWLHGHIHDSVSYKIGRTTLVANPRGLPTGFSARPQENLDFDPTLRIFVEGLPDMNTLQQPVTRLRVAMLQRGLPASSALATFVEEGRQSLKGPPTSSSLRKVGQAPSDIQQQAGPSNEHWSGTAEGCNPNAYSGGRAVPVRRPNPRAVRSD